MKTQQPDTTKIFALSDDAKTQFAETFSRFGENEINIIPFSNSWTSAQVADHVARAAASVAELLLTSTKTTDRKPDERAEEFKKIFLDFSVKFKSQPVILPTKRFYKKDELLNELKTSFEYLKKSALTTNLSEVINHHTLGETTKLEMVYLIVYHTARHTRQLENIYQVLQKEVLIH